MATQEELLQALINSNKYADGNIMPTPNPDRVSIADYLQEDASGMADAVTQSGSQYFASKPYFTQYNEPNINNNAFADGNYIPTGGDQPSIQKDIGNMLYQGGKKVVTDPIGVAKDIYQGFKDPIVKTYEGIETAIPEYYKGNINKGNRAIANSVWGGLETTANLADMIPFIPPVFGATKKIVGKASSELVDAVGNTPNIIKTDVFDDIVNKTAKFPPKKMADLPNIRELPIDVSLKIAEKEPHLILSGKGSEGAYVGGPRNIKNRDDLEAMRARFDQRIEDGVKGGDWYRRANTDIDTVTGSDARQNDFMSAQQAMYSAQSSPETELNFALRDNNSSIAKGLPDQSKTGGQMRSSIKAIETKDPSNYQLGQKTGEYANRINPNPKEFETATGVNDFRHLRNIEFTEVTGEAQVGAVGTAGHAFADYETALAVLRANNKKLGGRSDWTGEEIQAAPWVKQKGTDFYNRYKPRYMQEAAKELNVDYNPEILRNNSDPLVTALAKQNAFDYANTTIGDSFNKHTAFGTYEAQPFAGSGQLPGLQTATEAERNAFMADPRSTWATAPGNRDAIYSGMGLEDTGVNLRVRPTTQMRGEYTPPGGVLESNAGEVARPLVGFEYADIPGKFNNKGKPIKTTTKTMPQSEQQIMNVGEATRAYIDVQGAGAWHKNWLAGKVEDSKNVFVEANKPIKATESQINQAKLIANKYGYTDVIDTGQGLTVTNFDKPPTLNKLQRKNLVKELTTIDGYKDAYAINTDSGYLGFENALKQPQGTGAVTQQYLEYLNEAPKELIKALDNNPYIPQNALARISRDKAFSIKHGSTRADIENARTIIGKGPGWVGRLEKALKTGAILPAIAFVIFQSFDQDQAQPASQQGQIDA